MRHPLSLRGLPRSIVFTVFNFVLCGRALPEAPRPHSLQVLVRFSANESLEIRMIRWELPQFYSYAVDRFLQANYRLINFDSMVHCYYNYNV